MAELYQDITQCRLCGSNNLTEILSLGNQYLASQFVRSNDAHPLAEVKVPLTVMLCISCGLVQLKETVTRTALFQDYHYRSRTNPMMREALQDVVSALAGHIDVSKGDCVLDLGCNDGTLLSYWPSAYRRLGVEPATNISWEDLDKSIEIINDFFSARKVRGLLGDSWCKAVTSIAMLYSVEDVNRFMLEVKAVLANEGVWCIQVSYLPSIIKNLSFYDVCHEHLYYFSLGTLSGVLERNGLCVYDASTNDVNGGSLRVFVTHKEYARQPTKQYYEILQQEDAMNLKDPRTYQKLMEDVCEIKNKVTTYIRNERDKGRMVIGLGGSTKGNVLLQYFNIDATNLPYISERNAERYPSEL